MRKIAVITPVSHLEGIKELILEKAETVFYCEDWSKDSIRSVLLDFNIDTLLCNPNQQTYKIDKELLEDLSELEKITDAYKVKVMKALPLPFTLSIS